MVCRVISEGEQMPDSCLPGLAVEEVGGNKHAIEERRGIVVPRAPFICTFFFLFFSFDRVLSTENSGRTTLQRRKRSLGGAMLLFMRFLVVFFFFRKGINPFAWQG